MQSRKSSVRGWGGYGGDGGVQGGGGCGHGCDDGGGGGHGGVRDDLPCFHRLRHHPLWGFHFPFVSE